ncbi:MAG: hypothetical protein AAGK04_07190 [Planctomycetota bacterium]
MSTEPVKGWDARQKPDGDIEVFEVEILGVHETEDLVHVRREHSEFPYWSSLASRDRKICEQLAMFHFSHG